MPPHSERIFALSFSFFVSAFLSLCSLIPASESCLYLGAHKADHCCAQRKQGFLPGKQWALLRRFFFLLSSRACRRHRSVRALAAAGRSSECAAVHLYYFYRYKLRVDNCRRRGHSSAGGCALPCLAYVFGCKTVTFAPLSFPVSLSFFLFSFFFLFTHARIHPGIFF